MAIYYYIGATGGAWNVATNWRLAGTAGTTGLPTASDIAVLNNNGITITGTTGSIIDVKAIYGLYPLQGTVTSNASTLTGLGTYFTTELAQGTIVRRSDGVTIGTVTGITSDTSATLSGGATNAGVLAYGGGGTAATVSLVVSGTNAYSISAPDGIECGQIPVVSPSVFAISGATTGSTINIGCANGYIRGGATTSGTHNALKITSTNCIFTIGTKGIYGGVGAATDNYGINNGGAGNTINITATDYISGSSSPAIFMSATTGYISINSTHDLKAGTSVSAFTQGSNTSGTHIITCRDLIPSTSAPVIFGYSGTNAICTTLFDIRPTTLSTSGNSANPYAAIATARYLLTATTLKYYNNLNTEISYTVASSSPVYPYAQYVLAGSGTYGPGGTGYTPTLTLPSNSNVLTTQGVYGVGGTGSTGTYLPVVVSNVRKDINYGAASALQGTCYVPAQGVVLTGNLVDTADTGQLILPSAATVFSGVTYGSYSSTQGTLDIWSQSVTPYNDPTKFGGLINQLNTNLTSAQQVLGNVQSVSLSTQGTVLSIQSTGEINQTNILGAQSVLTTTNNNVISAQTVLTDVNTNVNSVQQVTGNIQQVTLSTQAVVDSIQTVTGTPQDIANQVWSDFDTNPNNSPYIQRVHNVSTVDTTGQQISTI
jgi:hypothetical protein